MISSKDFIFNSDLEYPPIVYDGIYEGAAAFATITLKAGLDPSYDYHVFQTVTNATYGTGVEKVRTAWIDASGNLKCNTTSAGNVYWRVYAY